MTCTEYGNVIVCHGSPHREVVRKSEGIKWCFCCRKRREFFYVVTEPIEPDYYGPTVGVECGTCKTVDADLFPGRFREWDI